MASPSSVSDTPIWQDVPARASASPVVFYRNGTVREARGLISITWITPW